MKKKISSLFFCFFAATAFLVSSSASPLTLLLLSSSTPDPVTTVSASFNGTTSDIDIGTGFNPERTDAFTLSAWVKISDFSTGNVVFSSWNGSTKGLLFVVNTPGDLEFYMCNSYAGNTIYTYTDAGLISINTWAHVAATYDGSSSASGVKLYINGVSKNVNIGFDSLSATTAGNNMKIGASTTLGWRFKGLMDEVAVFAGVKSGTFIATSLYGGGAPSLKAGSLPGATHYFRMGETPDTVSSFTDRVGSASGTGSNMALSADVPF